MRFWIATVAALGLMASTAHAGPSWSGCYVGANGSYNAGIVETIGLGAEGPGISGTVGCDFQSARFVIGPWAEYGWATYDWTTLDVDVEGWAVGARAGVLVVPDALLYVTAGYTDVAASVSGVPGSIDADGWLLGGGAEYKLGKSGLYLNGEYRYTMLSPSGVPFDVNTHSARLGLKFKFNWSPGSSDPFK